MRVGVVVATFGGEEWVDRAARAARSVDEQSVTPKFTWIHDPDSDDLANLRNAGAVNLYGEVDWLIFLDGDDELSPTYVEEMIAGTGDIRQPSTLGVREDGVEDQAPILIPKKSLIDGNYIVIGAMVNAELFFAAGGFRSLPIYEDWDLWLRMYNAGATIGAVPGAVYKVHQRSGSRNNNVAIQRRYYEEIRKSNLRAFRERGWE